MDSTSTVELAENLELSDKEHAKVGTEFLRLLSIVDQAVSDDFKNRTARGLLKAASEFYQREKNNE